MCSRDRGYPSATRRKEVLDWSLENHLLQKLHGTWKSKDPWESYTVIIIGSLGETGSEALEGKSKGEGHEGAG